MPITYNTVHASSDINILSLDCLLVVLVVSDLATRPHPVRLCYRSGISLMNIVCPDPDHCRRPDTTRVSALS